jgi:hypothetical protein
MPGGKEIRYSPPDTFCRGNESTKGFLCKVGCEAIKELTPFSTWVQQLSTVMTLNYMKMILNNAGSDSVHWICVL